MSESPVSREESETTAAADDGESERLLRMSRGFSCLFWSLPLLAAAHLVSTGPDLPVRWMIGGLLVSFLPLAFGLWMLGTCGEPTPRWRCWIGRVSLLSFVGMYLCPFLVWWSEAPTQIYFAANSVAHFVVMIAVLAGLNRLGGEAAHWLADVSLRRESKAGVGMVLWLSGCTVIALVWLYRREGVLDAGIPTVLSELAHLSVEARTLFLLPYAMTAYVMWRAKETGFRRAVRAET